VIVRNSVPYLFNRQLYGEEKHTVQTPTIEAIADGAESYGNEAGTASIRNSHTADVV
jgi:hypothetical protein